jgi:hypothetical protein
MSSVAAAINGFVPWTIISQLMPMSSFMSETEAFMQREGEYNAPKAILRQLRRSPTPPSDPRTSEETTSPPARTRTLSRSSESSTTISGFKTGETIQTVNTTGWREPQSFEIFRAVERKDVVFLMEVRYVHSCMPHTPGALCTSPAEIELFTYVSYTRDFLITRKRPSYFYAALVTRRLFFMP